MFFNLFEVLCGLIVLFSLGWGIKKIVARLKALGTRNKKPKYVRWKNWNEALPRVLGGDASLLINEK